MNQPAFSDANQIEMPPREIIVPRHRLGAARAPARQISVTDWRIPDYNELARRSDELGGGESIVEGLLPKGAACILIGDSGLGKSSLLYQMAMCVAAGVPFLGREVQRGAVLYMDFENGLADMRKVIEDISAFPGLEATQPNLYFWHFNDCSDRYASEGYRVSDMVEGLRPSLAIVDSLGAFNPEVEDANGVRP